MREGHLYPCDRRRVRSIGYVHVHIPEDFRIPAAIRITPSGMQGLIGMGVLIGWLHEIEKGGDVRRERICSDPGNVFQAGFPKRTGVNRIHRAGGRDRHIWLELEEIPA